jgi:hypothetical protein
MKKEYLDMGLGLLDLLEQNLPKVFQGIGRNELHSIAEKLCDLLNMAPNKRLTEKMVKRELFREAGQAEISSIIGHLVGSERVKREVELEESSGIQKVYLKLQ